MDSRSVVFLQVMGAIAIVAVLSFLIFLVSRQAMRAQGGGRAGRTQRYQPQWYEFLLAALVLVIAAILALWQLLPWAGADWGGEGRPLTFFVLMLVIGGAGLLLFLIVMFLRVGRGRAGAPAATPIAAAAAPAPRAPEATARHEAPSATRLIGLLGFAVGFLLLCWAHVPVGQQAAMMAQLVYPAGLVVVLVMMVDKASRQWDVKLPGEAAREWLHINAVVFLYLIGYLNLLSADASGGYGGLFWDTLHVVLFVLIVWVLDRKTTRLRFLLAHAYLIVLPVLLVIWRAQMGIDAAEGISWWGTIWPFFFLAVIGFVLELIILIANRDSDAQGAGTAKDVVFLVVYIVLLLIARPEAVA